jgi:Secretion system C-terminal sorting domain
MKKNLLCLIFLFYLPATVFGSPSTRVLEGLNVLAPGLNTKLIAMIAPANDDKLYVSEQIDVSNIYPNPATDQTALDYVLLDPRMNAKITIRNVLGSIMGEYVLDRNERSLNIPVSHYVAGIYFYTLTIESKNVVTKKLIIKR